MDTYDSKELDAVTLEFDYLPYCLCDEFKIVLTLISVIVLIRYMDDEL